MNRSAFNHGKSGDTNPKGRSRSPLLKLYPRLLRSEREEIIGHRASAACGGRPRLCYTLDEGKETERETTNCPPKRVRSNPPQMAIQSPDHLAFQKTRCLRDFCGTQCCFVMLSGEFATDIPRAWLLR